MNHEVGELHHVPLRHVEVRGLAGEVALRGRDRPVALAQPETCAGELALAVGLRVVVQLLFADAIECHIGARDGLARLVNHAAMHRSHLGVRGRGDEHRDPGTRPATNVRPNSHPIHNPNPPG